MRKIKIELVLRLLYIHHIGVNFDSEISILFNLVFIIILTRTKISISFIKKLLLISII